jgi:hypothetical protein
LATLSNPFAKTGFDNCDLFGTSSPNATALSGHAGLTKDPAKVKKNGPLARPALSLKIRQNRITP